MSSVGTIPVWGQAQRAVEGNSFREKNYTQVALLHPKEIVMVLAAKEGAATVLLSNGCTGIVWADNLMNLS